MNKSFLLIFFPVLCLLLAGERLPGVEKPNVILVICDDLNDYVEPYKGHPQTRTPNIGKLARSGVTFTQAHCNIPICGPSRASMFTGIYPHHSGCFGFTRWDTYQVLKNSRTIMDHFRANGYYTLGTGKLMHHRVASEWDEYGNPADYGPFVLDGENRIAHPDVPKPFREIGTIDGSFGPLKNLSDNTGSNGRALKWVTGGWQKTRELKVATQDKRDKTADEINGDWAVKRLKALATQKGGKPFFMGVGLIRPHTPLVVPQKFFDAFPLQSIKLPVIKKGDVEDTYARSIRSNSTELEPGSKRTLDMGTRLYQDLVASYPTREEALQRFIQAYLASVASVDEQVGRILDTLKTTGLAENTILVFTSDHGWGMGEKDYLYKNSLWQESTQVPLIIRVPGNKSNGKQCIRPVSLIDLYPTLIDLCDLRGDTKKNSKGHDLDGQSLVSLLESPATAQLADSSGVLTALYKWAMSYDPTEQSYSLRNSDWRYIRYENGKEELYRTSLDPYEWSNLAEERTYNNKLKELRQQLHARLPKPGTVPPQPAFVPKASSASGKTAKGKTAKGKTGNQKTAEKWKAEYFIKHPKADANRDGKLSWPELKAYREKIGDLPPQKKK